MAREWTLPDELKAITTPWINSGGVGNHWVTSVTARTDVRGNGGAAAFYVPSNVGSLQTPVMPDGLNEFWIAGGYRWTVGAALWTAWQPASGGAAGSIRFIASGQIELLIGGALITTSAGAPLVDGQYIHLRAHIYIHDINGFAKIWIDKTPVEIPDIDFSGDTRSGTQKNDRFIWYTGQFAYIDDWALNSITLEYDVGTSGIPAAGITITDGTSGATAVVTALRTGGGATTGILVLENWNEIAFGDNNIITGTSFSANVNAPTADYTNGFQPQSGDIGNEFNVLLVPNAVGNSSDLNMFGTGTPATETLTLAGQPNDGDQVLIDAKTYTFQTVLTNADGNVLIGAAATDTIDNLIAAIVIGAGSGTLYAALTTIHPTCTAVVGAGDTMDASTNYNGTVWNGTACTDPTDVSGNLSWGAATMTGGTGENYQAVDDVPTTSGTYVESLTATDRDTYKLDISNLPPDHEIGSINHVTIALNGYSDLGAITKVNRVIRQGGTDYDGPDTLLTTTTSQIMQSVDTQPDGTGEWDRAAVVDSGFEAGVELVA